MKLKNTLYLTLLLICTLMAGAHADIKYTQTMTAGGDEDATPMMHSAHYVAQGKERNETEMSMGNYNSKEALVTLCESHQTIHIDDALKIYAITTENPEAAASVSPAKEKQRESPEKEGTGKIAINVKVTDLNPEKVAGWDTKHYMVEMHTQNSGCVGDDSSDMKMELWVADVKDAHGCKPNVDYGTLLGQREDNKCKVTYETTGDYGQLAHIWDGLVMRQKMFDKNGKVMMIQEITSLSQAKLDDSVFAIPDDYTKLSIEEYNKERQQAMMQAMMGGNIDNADTDDNKNNSDKNSEQDKKPKNKNRGFRIPGLPF